MSNPWAKFQELIAPGAKTLVSVTTVHSNGTTTVTLRDGSEVLVQGDSVAAGSKAFIQDGKIVGKAPDLPVQTVSV